MFVTRQIQTKSNQRKRVVGRGYKTTTSYYVGAKFDSRQLTKDLLNEINRKKSKQEAVFRSKGARLNRLIRTFGPSPRTPELRREYRKIQRELLSIKRIITMLNVDKKRLESDLKQFK